MLDLTKKFGRLTIIRLHHHNKHRQSMYLCSCDCGNEKIISGNNIKNGIIKSCGCLRKEGGRLKHGYSKTKIYRVWSGIIQRCNNPNNKDYKDYGGRGIVVCKRWLKFENFLKDMGEVPFGLTLDRINNDKNYYKKNCRWATWNQQANNRRNNKKGKI
jgi:hypothetical protein